MRKLQYSMADGEDMCLPVNPDDDGELGRGLNLGSGYNETYRGSISQKPLEAQCRLT